MTSGISALTWLLLLVPMPGVVLLALLGWWRARHRRRRAGTAQ